MQMAFYSGEQFPAKYRGGAFIAFHGSWNRAPRPQKGYNVTFVPFDEKGMPRGTYEVFASGFPGREEFTSPRDARFRPTGLAVGPDGSLYVTDSEKGRVWRIIYTGTSATAGATGAATTGPAAKKTVAAAKPAGADVYAQACQVCHMADGRGVPNMQPDLTESALLKGKPDALITLLLRGPDKVLPASRKRYSNQMPEFSSLSDTELAGVATYVRRRFGGVTGAITAAQVAAMRQGRASAP
jgi:mono/diheme cytochrome c family protein